MSIAQELSWMDDGLCAEYPHVDFFPDRGNRKAIKKAKAICNKCLVKETCLEWAYDTKQPDGIFGGFTTVEIRELGGMISLRKQLEQPVSIQNTPVQVPQFKLITNPKPFVLNVPSDSVRL